MNILGSEANCHFHARAIARRKKAQFPLRMCRILFAAKYSWTALHMSRPLLILQAVICRSLGRLSANEKKEKFASNDNNYLSLNHWIMQFIRALIGLANHGI